MCTPSHKDDTSQHGHAVFHRVTGSAEMLRGDAGPPQSGGEPAGGKPAPTPTELAATSRRLG
eukprot:scaffold841_cov397-Prasinococcus_capsulatus_cf.AAC.2